MTEQELFKQLRGRCPINQLSLNDEVCNYPNEFHAELMKIKEHNPYYVKTVLKSIIDKEIDIEWIYEEYMEVLNISPPTGGNYEDIIEYPLSNIVTIKIWEKPKLISCLSTTGFRTWEAALYLCIYFSKIQLNANTTFLELGAGTGLVSMFLYKQLNGQCKNYITDGDTNLLEDSLLKNLKLNDINSKKIIRQRLIWNEDKNIPMDVDILIGADITYDSTYFPQLCQCIHDFLYNDGSKCKEMIISCTVRSNETLAAFHNEIGKMGLNIELINDNDNEIISQMESILYKKLIAPIHVYRITK